MQLLIILVLAVTAAGHPAAPLFQSLRHEISPSEKLRLVGGPVPEFISGVLYRNGFGKFESRQAGFEFNHLFDTLALLMKFTIHDGDIWATIKLLDSKYYNESLYRVPPYRTLGGLTPPMTPVERGETFFHLMHDNLNANIVTYGKQLVAINDIVGGTIIAADSLDAQGRYFPQHILDIITSTHPMELNGRIYNYESIIGESPEYKLYWMNQSESHPVRNYFLTLQTERLPYMHSFGLTEKHMILIEFPLFWNIEEIILSDAILPTMKWLPENGTDILVINYGTGDYRRVKIPEAVFGLHVINSYEIGNRIIVDFIGYNNSDIMYDFYLDRLRNGDAVACGDLYRLVIIGDRAYLSLHKSLDMEMPRINPDYHYQSYRYFYGITGGVASGIAKYDWKTGEQLVWSEPEQYATEPVFIPRSSGNTEDDGVLLSVVLDSANTASDSVSYLAIIDAKKMKVITKAYLTEPLPLTCHGNFIRKV